MNRKDLRHGTKVVGPALVEGRQDEEWEYAVIGGLGSFDHVVLDHDGVPYRLNLEPVQLRRFKVITSP